MRLPTTLHRGRQWWRNIDRRICFLPYERIKTKVGDRLKTPETPIWVVCSESHYSVLFSIDRSIVPPASSLTTAAAAREQSKQGTTHDHTSVTSTSGSTASIETNIPPCRTDGTTNDRAVGGGRGNNNGSGVGGGGGGGGRWGVYDGAGDGKSRQEEGDELEAFDLEYYDGLGRQDEVSYNSDPRISNDIASFRSPFR